MTDPERSWQALRGDPAASASLDELVAVAERLEDALGHGDPHMDGSSHITYAKYRDKPGQEMVRVPSLMMADLRMMADALRVAMNIAGDIDHIVGTLEGASEVLLGPHGPTVQARQIGELCEELATRLRRIAAGIREQNTNEN